MSETLSSITSSGSGSLSTKLISTGIILAGATGSVLTVTPPQGQKVRLTHLSTGAGSSESGITVSVGGTDVFSGALIRGDEPWTSAVSIGNYQPYTYVSTPRPPQGNSLSVLGKSESELVITKDTGSTGTDLYYAYELGE